MSGNQGVVVVTGGASGIGLALAQGLLDEGRKVLVLDSLADRVASAGQALRVREPGQLGLETADVTDETRMQAVVDACEAEFGAIEGLVNSAGIAKELSFFDTDVASFRRILEVNVIGSFVAARAVAAKMRTRNQGSIVNISSVSGVQGNYGRTAYGASKGAVITMTKVMAVELAELGIRVNALAPGPIDTPMTKVVHTAAARRHWVDAVPMRRYGQAEELCGTVSWLLDEARSGYVTGQVIAVDGGFTTLGLARAPQG